MQTNSTVGVFVGAAAVLFDLDGVLTPTATVHELAWRRLFEEYLATAGHGPAYRDTDYFDHIDGKPRFDGVRDFLASRGVVLPEGSEGADPDELSVQGLGNRKNQVFNTIIESEGVNPYPGSVRFLDSAVQHGLQVAVVSSSRNAPAVLRAAGLDGYFTVVVDGTVATREQLPGKPAPDTYSYAADLLGLPGRRCIVVEDAVSGVRAGSAGDFHSVIGVDRGAGRQTLLTAGATTVVTDLAELL